MPALWVSTDYCKQALLPYEEIQIGSGEFAQAIFKAQAWVRAKISPAISAKATEMTTIPDDAPLKLCVALWAAYFVTRKRFMQRGPTKNEWVMDLKKDAEEIVALIALNPSKALAGTTISQDAVGTMGLQSSKEGVFPTGTLLSETQTLIDPKELNAEAVERGFPPAF